MQNVLAARILVTLLTFSVFHLYLAAFPVGDWRAGFATVFTLVAAFLLLGCCGVAWTGLPHRARPWGLLLIGAASLAAFVHVRLDFLEGFLVTLLIYGLILLVYGFVWWLAAHPSPRRAGLDLVHHSPEQIAAYPLTARNYYRLAARLITGFITIPLLGGLGFLMLIAFAWGGPQWWVIPIALVLLMYPAGVGISCLIGLPLLARQIGLGIQALLCSTLVIAIFAVQYEKDGMDSLWYLLPGMVFAVTYAYLWWLATQPRQPLLAPAQAPTPP